MMTKKDRNKLSLKGSTYPEYDNRVEFCEYFVQVDRSKTRAARAEASLIPQYQMVEYSNDEVLREGV